MQKKKKVKSLNEIISNNNKVIESLNKNYYKEKAEESQKESKCRYWNIGYCREGDNFHFTHPIEDCKIHLKTGECEDRKCAGRHKKQCRYYNSHKGCFRQDQCQYLHSKKKEEDYDEEKGNPEYTRRNNQFSCDQCNFQTSQKMKFKKHINMKHEEASFSETVSSFIYRL